MQVIIEKLHGSDIDDLDKRKFLVPSDLTIGQLIWIIRKRVKLPAEKALYVYVNRTIPVARLASAFIIIVSRKHEGGRTAAPLITF